MATLEKLHHRNCYQGETASADICDSRCSAPLHRFRWWIEDLSPEEHPGGSNTFSFLKWRSEVALWNKDKRVLRARMFLLNRDILQPQALVAFWRLRAFTELIR